MDEEDAPPAPKAAPARPPNPELLRLHQKLHARVVQRMGMMSHALSNEARSLTALSQDLDQGSLAIVDEKSRLEAVRDVCCSHAERMTAHNTFAARTLETVQTKIVEQLEGSAVGDDWIMATSIPGHQYVGCLCFYLPGTPTPFFFLFLRFPCAR